MLNLGWSWRAALALGILLALGAAAAPAHAGGPAKPSASRSVSDYTLLERDLQSVGALKFYEDTEELLRTGEFERAFCRYLMLKTHIRGQALYAALTVMVDQRLHFLRSQLSLKEPAAPLHSTYRRYKKVSKKKSAPPACPPSADQKGAKAQAEPGTPTTADKGKPPESGAPSVAPGKAGDTQPSEEKKPPSSEAQEEKPEKEKEEKKPEPPPSYWQKLKRKLQFWK